MCLDTLADFKIHKYEGWCVFIIRDDNNLCQLFIHNTLQEYQTSIITGKWQKDVYNYMIWTSNNHLYQTGFHIFLRKKDAEFFAQTFFTPTRVSIRKVKFRKIVAEGYQYENSIDSYRELKVVVARERFVLN